MAEVNLPPNIENYARIALDLQSRDRLSGEQKKKLALCKLRIALWSCTTEGIPVTRYSLAEILGPDTSFVFQHAQTALLEINWESEEDRTASRKAINALKNRGSRNKGGSSNKGGGASGGGGGIGLGTYS